MPPPEDSSATFPPVEPSAALQDHLRELRARLDRARTDEPGDLSRQLLVADLETAYEELRVADEEVRTQQEEMSRLLESHRLLQWQQERIVATLPVPTLTTDEHGIIRTVNAAAAGLVEMRVARLLGKPVLTVFPLEVRAELRRLIATQARDGLPLQWHSRVERRDGSSAEVDVTAAALGEPGEGSTWMLLESGSSPPGALVGPRLPEALSRLAVLPASSESLQDLIHRAVAICHDVLGPDVELTISVGPPSEPDALASTGQVAQELDGAQIVRAAGPCVMAFETRSIVLSEDVRTDTRWPSLHGDVPEEVGAAIAVPLLTGDRLVGALNVYGTGAPVDDLAGPVELLGATLAAVLYEFGLKNELRDLASDMERALTSRAVIDQAKGIIMADRGVSADEAFEHLVHLSSTQQLKLRDVARALVERRAGPDHR